MTIHFIGAGPGAADLITVRGRDLIARSPVCLYAGSLVPKALLEHVEDLVFNRRPDATERMVEFAASRTVEPAPLRPMIVRSSATDTWADMSYVPGQT